MKSELILYYTLGGSTEAGAKKLSAKTGGDLVRVFEQRRRTLLTAFLPGCPKAMRRTPSAIRPVSVNPDDYEHITLCCPVWAGYPAPAFNAMLALVPAGKRVSVILFSAGGETPKSAEGTKDLLASRGLTLTEYRDVRTAPEKA